ncbi:MAG: lipase family protein [Nitrospirales bacterium]
MPCAVHRGFYLAYHAVRDAIVKEVKALSPSHIYVTGHSLGGALATLGVLDLQLEFPSLGVSMYNFGSPRVGERMFAMFYNRIVHDSHRVVLPGDAVPLVPPQELSYHHVEREHTLRADVEDQILHTGTFEWLDVFKRHAYGREDELKCYREQLLKDRS